MKVIRKRSADGFRDRGQLKHSWAAFAGEGKRLKERPQHPEGMLFLYSNNFAQEMRGPFSMTLRISLPRTNIRSAVAASMLCLTIYTVVHAQNAQPMNKPFVVEYYYKAKWGYADEFIRLFKKNHYPFLKKLAESGKIVQVTGESPIYHTTEEGRWDYRVRIVWKNLQVANDNTGDEQILRQLFPDQDTFKREEQRRFEILLAHWDVPIKSVKLDEK